MSAVMGHTQRPDNTNSTKSSNPSLMQNKISPISPPKSSKGVLIVGPGRYGVLGNNTSSEIDAHGTKRKQNTDSESSNHRRQPSGPFDIIYDRSPVKTQPRPSPNVKSEQFKSPSYIEIERAILSGHKFAGDTTSPHVPTVTMIDKDSLRRSGSVISNDASIRHRNTIKRRNKMVRREAVEQNGASSSSVFSSDSKERKATKTKSRRSKLLSIFPVRRRTSYKYYPVSKSETKPRFSSQKDVDKYFLLNNITSLMNDILPNTMAMFNFKRLERVNPALESHPTRFAVSRNAQFTNIEPRHGARQASKVGLQGTRDFDSSILNTTDTVNRSGIAQSIEDSDFVKRRIFLAKAYARYRKFAFSGRRDTPLKLENALPFESEMMTQTERETLNTQILLEVLLRRTVSAKIDFRLNQNRPKNSSNSRSSSFSSSNNSFTPSDYMYLRGKKETDKKEDDSNDKGGDDSNNRKPSTGGHGEPGNGSPLISKNVLRNNISSKQNALGPKPANFENVRDGTEDIGLVAPTVMLQKLTASENLPNDNKRVTSKDASTKSVGLNSTNQAENPTSIGYPYGLSPKKPNSKKSSSLDSKSFPRSPMLESVNEDASLGNVNLALLRPLNRSQETISSSSPSEHVLYAKRSYSGLRGNGNNSSSFSSSSASDGHNRNSRSTIDTSMSIVHDLGSSDDQAFPEPDKSDFGSTKFISEFGSLRSQSSMRAKTDSPSTVKRGVSRDNLGTEGPPFKILHSDGQLDVNFVSEGDIRPFF
ncbi:hypothetical protein JCM33374_g2835 [Metschnikowia sp. JCM 33374]|nr:hypothetical protein JCM33374_g2835 [Metschnikowia sp. JCM 33374]